MFRPFMLAALLAVPLSCAHSGHIVRYSVYCPQTGCLSKVSYRGAEGTEQSGAVNSWNHQFSSTSGGQYELTVRRTDMSRRGSLYIRVYIDDLEVASDHLEPGDAGPVTLAGEIQ